ncbi:MAG TPA: putative Ig domain-containing protein, partial [Nitrospiraceae bacterium]|nr:putative Ig domain-containing protein [Nitrospiraceae bacterium]
TGVISGTPSAASTFNFTPHVTDSLSLTDTTPPALSVVISTSAPNITTLTLPDGTVGTAYNQTLSATGGAGTLVWSPISGSLPSNLSLSPAGVISGTPTGTGTANFTVQVTDGFSQTDTQDLSIIINAAPQPLTITTASPLPSGKVGDDFGTVTPASPVTLTASGGTPPYTWSTTVSPPLPSGLSIDAAGTISGTPTADEANISHTFTVTDSTNLSANKDLSLTIAP